MFEGSLSLVAYVKIFVAMIVIVNPLGIMPVFVAMTVSHTDNERKNIARIAAQTVAAVLLISAVFGELILDMFGISIGSNSSTNRLGDICRASAITLRTSPTTVPLCRLDPIQYDSHGCTTGGCNGAH